MIWSYEANGPEGRGHYAWCLRRADNRWATVMLEQGVFMATVWQWTPERATDAPESTTAHSALADAKACAESRLGPS